jgi:hypothetical protein
MELAYPPRHEMPTLSIDPILDGLTDALAAMRLAIEGGR